MNKFTRFTLFAGMMAIGLAACGDDVEVVQPEPPDPPPVEAALEPASVVVDIGETVNLSVNVTGGPAGEQATWTCTSSSTSIATTSVTASGCQVTGVDSGNASVTAVVSKGGETVNAGASVVVPPDTSVPATIVIEKVTQGSLDTPVNLNSVRRQVEVTVNIDPGTQVIEQVELLFRGEVVASQTLTPSQAVELLAAVQDDSPEAQVLRTLTFSWETDSYVIDDGGDGIDGTDTAMANYLNGQGPLVAQVLVEDASEGEGDAVRSAPEQVTLRNRNGFHLHIDRLGSERVEQDVQGFSWRGGRDDAGNIGSGIDAHLLAVVYTPDSATPATDDALNLASAQFNFAVGGLGTPGGITRVVSSAPWTWTWTPGALSGYSMPVATPAFPNQLRDGEYPRLIGDATLDDGQGMGPYGGALDCTGGLFTQGSAIGILNIEFTEEQVFCPGGEGWTPPSATTVADASTTLDPLRSGERIDNYAPTGATFALNSRPGFPNYPQIPSTPNTGGPVSSSGVWVNDMLDFTDLLGTGSITDGVDSYGTPTGVSRAVAGFPAPEFLPPLYYAANGDEEEITDDPTTGNPFFDETATFDVYSASSAVRDELDNRRNQGLTGASGTLVFGVDFTNPTLMHTVASQENRTSYDLVTVGADDPTTDFYYVSWTDPITTAASGFSAFGGNPVWRHIHRVFPAGPQVVVGGTGTAVMPTWSSVSGVTNYSRELASQQPVTGLSTDFGYFIYRSYALDDAGNVTHDGTATIAEPELEVPTYSSPLVRRQAAVAPEQPTVFGITAPVLMQGGSTVTFVSNASHNFDLGLGWFSLDYPTFQDAGYWGVAAAPAPNSGPGAYYTPASTAAPVQGTTGGVRFEGADWIIGQPESKIYDDTDFESVATLVPTSPLSQDVPGFLRSIEWVCFAGAAGCPAAPADWTSIEANLQENAIGGGTSAGWFADEGAAADAGYEANRVSLGSFTAFDATRWDPRTNVYSGTTNTVLEQIGSEDGDSPFPNRSVSTAPINPVSVPLNEVAGTITAVYTDDVVGPPTGDHTAWAIASASGSIGGSFDRTASISITARLIGASTVKNAPAPPGQNLFSRVDYFVLEPGTGTLRWGANQMNPVLTENEPGCVDNAGTTQDQYRCWDFSANINIANLVNAPSGSTVYVVAVGSNANGDAVATYPVELILP